MNRRSSDRDVLFGLVAVSKQFLTAEELIDAVTEWTDDQQSSALVDTLIRRGCITPSQRELVDSAVQAESESQWDTVLPELLSTSAIEAARETMDSISDGGVRKSLDRFLTIVGFEARPPSSTSPPIPSEQFRFQIRKELARGGLGQVFVARDKQLNRNVALKQILERWQDHETCNERFLAEAEITGRLEHPGVVPVYALGHQPDGRYYYAMRLIRGVTLEDEINRFFDPQTSHSLGERNLEIRKLLRRFIDVCNTIEYAHSRGVIHRDLKPANIMLGKYGETLVVDWGLAKQVDVAETRPAAAESLLLPGSGSGSAPTQFGSALGTPQFMSPEQAAGQLDRIGPASDIYCLGATFYHLLTGKPPQTDTSLQLVLDKVKRGEFPDPCSVRHDVAKPLEAVCLKAMQLNAGDRYRSAADLAQDIERWLADQRVHAYREPLLSKAARGVRRHQTLVASGTVATVLLCVAAVVGSIVWQQTQARQREHAHAIAQQQMQRDQEDRQRLAERRSSAEANLRFGLVEAEAGRLESALSFFQQGMQACGEETRLADQLARLSEPAREMSRLVEFQRLADETMMAVALQEDRRAMHLIAAGLLHLGVFENADWWDHLPVHYLSRQQADRVEKQVHLDLTTLSSLLAKSVVSPELIGRRMIRLPPPKFDDHQLQTKEAVYRVRAVAQTYRPSEWLDRIEKVGRFLYGELNALPQAPKWRTDNFVDAYYLGAMCSLASIANDNGFASLFAQQTLGVEDPAQAAATYLRRATELEPNSYLAHVLLGWVQQRAGNFDEARGTLSHGIALRPDMILAYDLRSIAYLDQAIDTEDPIERRRLQLSGLRDANTVCGIAPQFELGHWLRGNALRELNQDSQAVLSYLAALQREPPVDMIRMDQWVFLLQGRDANRARRLGDLLPDRFDEARHYAQQLHEQDAEDPLYVLLDATAALALDERDDAQELAARVLELASETNEESTTDRTAGVIAQAYAIQGEVYRKNSDFAEARDAFSESLQRDPENTLATEGLALTLERLAQDSSDALQSKLAYAAYQRLAEVSCVNWQLVRAHRGRYRLLLESQDLEQAAGALEATLQADRGQDLSKLIELAEHHGATEILARLSELNIGERIVGVSEADRLPSTLAVRNGHFELGLDFYWEPWVSMGACHADARTDEQTRSGSQGSTSLLIQHHSAASPGSFAMIKQVVPVVGGSRYQISIWAKGEQVAVDGVRIVMNAQRDQPIIVLPSGSYQWQRFSGEFTMPGIADVIHPLSTSIEIVSTAPGKVWLDDLRIERIVP